MCALTGCSWERNESAILLTPLDEMLSAENTDGLLSLRDGENALPIFSIDRAAHVTLRSGYELTLDTDSTDLGLALLVTFQGIPLARVVLVSDPRVPLILSDGAVTSSS